MELIPETKSSGDHTSKCVQDYQKKEDLASRHESRKADCEKVDAVLYADSSGSKTDSEANKVSTQT